MTNFNESRIKNKNLLHPELSYCIQGVIFAVANKYGKGLKESIYQKALAEEFSHSGLRFEEQKRIKIYSLTTGRVLGTYIPDFVIEDSIIIEIKATDFSTRQDISQQQSYLKASIYEVAYLVNFCTPRLYMKRSIYTNNHKSFIALLKKDS